MDSTISRKTVSQCLTRSKQLTEGAHGLHCGRELSEGEGMRCRLSALCHVWGGAGLYVFFIFLLSSMLSPRTERPCGVVSGVVARCCPDKHLSSKLSRLRRADKAGDKFVSICRKNYLHNCLHGAATFVQAGPIVSDVVSVHVADMTRKCGRQKKDTKKIIVPPTWGRGIKRKITPQN